MAIGLDFENPFGTTIRCKHLWITAIDRDKLAKGTVDPSAAPFFIPGQTLAAQYVSPQWTKAVIAPPQ